MTTSRRDLLKLFGAGTVIASVSSGATARLIEVPKAEIIKPDTSIVAPFCPDDIETVDVTFRMKDGSLRRMQNDSVAVAVRTFSETPRYLSDVRLEIAICEEVANSPSWYKAVALVKVDGRVGNRNAVVELK